MRLSLNNIFYTIQGEGPLTGKPSIFIRTVGCNLRCIWCDTKYTWLYSDKTLINLKNITDTDMHYKIGDKVYDKEKEKFQMDLEEVLKKIKCYPAKHVVITGGEPLLQKQALNLFTDKLLKDGYTIEIETNGTISPHGLNPSIKFNVSPKLKNSFNPKDRRYNKEALRDFLSHEAIYKFVVSNEEDLEEVIAIEKDIRIPKSRIYLMPEAVNSEELRERSTWVINNCKKLNYQYSHRLHIELFGTKRGV